jgi:hypothetical protein
VQLTQLGVGGDFQYDSVRARLMTQFGLYSQTTPRNDASPARGQWNLNSAYRYVSEAYGGYHFNAAHGVNVDAGLFLSYIGPYSFYQYDNWAYQPSYVSSNTPWFFNGVRIQIYTSDTLKISIQVKYFDQPDNWLGSAATTLPVDVGCEFRGGLICPGGDANTPPQWRRGMR